MPREHPISPTLGLEYSTNATEEEHPWDKQRASSDEDAHDEGVIGMRRLTLKMSGGRKHAQRACGRPLD